MGIGADEQPAGERIVLQDDLVNDARARRPEPDAVSCTDGFEERVYLVVLEQRRLKICVGAHMRPNQVIAMHRGWRGDRVPTREHELQQRHLGCRVLHRHPVGPNLQVAFQRREVIGRRVIQMAEEQLFGQRERAVVSFADHGEARAHARVRVRDQCGGRLDHRHVALLSGPARRGIGGCAGSRCLTQLSRISSDLRERDPSSWSVPAAFPSTSWRRPAAQDSRKRRLGRGRMTRRLAALLATARPVQWLKNVVVLAPLIFAQRLTDGGDVLRAVAMFAIFGVLASGVYFINDAVDAPTGSPQPAKDATTRGRGPGGTRAAAVVLGVVPGGDCRRVFPLCSALGCNAGPRQLFRAERGLQPSGSRGSRSWTVWRLPLDSSCARLPERLPSPSRSRPGSSCAPSLRPSSLCSASAGPM